MLYYNDLARSTQIYGSLTVIPILILAEMYARRRLSITRDKGVPYAIKAVKDIVLNPMVWIFGAFSFFQGVTFLGDPRRWMIDATACGRESMRC